MLGGAVSAPPSIRFGESGGSLVDQTRQVADHGFMNKTWSRALEMARATPPSRNRYVDFLRAASIMVVVFGHWLMAGAFFANDELTVFNLLSENSNVHYLTWILQVMPIFFLVGGFANAASWRAAQRKQESYGSWLRARLRRLLLPVVPLLIVWSFGAAVLLDRGVDFNLVQLGSQAALVPVWFLATYVAIVAFTPLTLSAWERWGWLSIVAHHPHRRSDRPGLARLGPDHRRLSQLPVRLGDRAQLRLRLGR